MPLTGAQTALNAGWRERDEEIGIQVGRGEAVRLAKQVITVQELL